MSEVSGFVLLISKGVTFTDIKIGVIFVPPNYMELGHSQDLNLVETVGGSIYVRFGGRGRVLV